MPATQCKEEDRERYCFKEEFVDLIAVPRPHDDERLRSVELEGKKVCIHLKCFDPKKAPPPPVKGVLDLRIYGTYPSNSAAAMISIYNKMNEFLEKREAFHFIALEENGNQYAGWIEWLEPTP